MIVIHPLTAHILNTDNLTDSMLSVKTESAYDLCESLGGMDTDLGLVVFNYATQLNDALQRREWHDWAREQLEVACA